MALSKGMSASEFAKLKERLAATKFKKESKDGGGRSRQRFWEKARKIRNTKIKDSVNALILVLSCLIIPP
jgi:hypothetical protein